MSFATKFNKGRKFEINTEGFEFASRADLIKRDGEGAVYPLTAIYINTKSKYGSHPVFATDKFFVDAPNHMLEIAEDILLDAEAISQINDGKVGFALYTFKSDKYNVESIGIKFVDME